MLEYEDDNKHDRNNAMKVLASSEGQNWGHVGYLSSEHARVARAIMGHSIGQPTIKVPDFSHVYETRLEMRFIVDTSRNTTRLVDSVRDVCGEATMVLTT